MAGVEPYWRRDAGTAVPFSTLLSFVEKFYHPEIRHDNYRVLISRAQKNRPDDVDMQMFKRDLISLLEGNRRGLHPEALTEAAWYDEEDDTALLLRLWGDLYPDEEPPGRGESPGGGVV